MKYIIVVLSFLIASQSSASTWNRANDPAQFGQGYEYRFAALPLKGRVSEDKMPWSETYWAAVKGSINYRWNSPSKAGFGYTPPSREAVMRMSRDELAQLSPSEKYDLAMGHYNYPLKHEADYYADTHAKYWNGICHGWAPAALQFKEPKPVDFVNPDGISIPFGSSDVKGLLSFFMAFHADVGIAQVGVRCRKFERALGLPMCKDTNAGALHVIMANELGLRGTGFVAEVDPGSEIWNQPVHGFEVKSYASIQARGNAASAVKVEAEMNYTDELEESQWAPANGTSAFRADKMKLSYILELDTQGRIIGGEWLSNEIPDFVWKTLSPAQFTGEFEGLKQIYQAN